MERASLTSSRIVQGTQVLGQLYEANECALRSGRRASIDALDYHAFYNDAVNQEVNLKEDYRRRVPERHT